MMSRIRVPGVVDNKPQEPDLGDLGRRGARSENVWAVEVGTRRAGEATPERDVKPDSIVELSLDSGAKFYHRYDQLAADLPRAEAEPQASRIRLICRCRSWDG